MDRGGHQERSNDGGAGQRRQQAEGEQQPAAGFRDSRHGGHCPAGPEAQGVEERAGPGEPVAAEPAEELLCAVADQQRAEHEAHEEQGGVHGFLHPNQRMRRLGERCLRIQLFPPTGRGSPGFRRLREPPLC